MGDEYVFNVGDKVVEINMEYSTNAAHYDKFLYVHTVVDADKDYFSTNYKFDNWLCDKFHQSSGKFTGWSKKRYYHLKKDSAGINELITEGVNALEKKFKEDNGREIKRKQNQIQNLQEEINILASGKGKVYAFDITQEEMRKSFWETLNKKLIDAI